MANTYDNMKKQLQDEAYRKMLNEFMNSGAMANSSLAQQIWAQQSPAAAYTAHGYGQRKAQGGGVTQQEIETLTSPSFYTPESYGEFNKGNVRQAIIDQTAFINMHRNEGVWDAENNDPSWWSDKYLAEQLAGYDDQIWREKTIEELINSSTGYGWKYSNMTWDELLDEMMGDEELASPYVEDWLRAYNLSVPADSRMTLEQLQSISDPVARTAVYNDLQKRFSGNIDALLESGMYRVTEPGQATASESLSFRKERALKEQENRQTAAEYQAKLADPQYRNTMAMATASGQVEVGGKTYPNLWLWAVNTGNTELLNQYEEMGYGFLLPEELLTYQQLYEINPADAMGYLKSRNRELNVRRKAFRDAEKSLKATDGFWNGIISWAEALGTPIEDILTGDILRQTYHAWKGDADPNAYYFDAQNDQSIIRGAQNAEIKEKFGSTAAFFYDAFNSIADVGLTTGLDIALGGTGLVNAGLNATKAYSGGLQSNAARDIQGLWSVGQALGDAGIEALFEKLGFDGSTKSANAIWNFLRNAFGEGAEEVFTNMGTTAFDAVISAAHGRDNTLVEMYKAYTLAGAENPGMQVALDKAAELGMDFTMGAIAGGTLGGVQSAADALSTRNLGKSIAPTINEDALLEIARAMPEGSESRRLANKYFPQALTGDVATETKTESKEPAAKTKKPGKLETPVELTGEAVPDAEPEKAEGKAKKPGKIEKPVELTGEAAPEPETEEAKAKTKKPSLEGEETALDGEAVPDAPARAKAKKPSLEGKKTALDGEAVPDAPAESTREAEKTEAKDKKKDNKPKLSFYQLGKLTQALEVDLQEEYSRITNDVMDSAIANRLMELGDDAATARKNAPIVRKVYRGQEVTLTERTGIAWNKNASQVARELASTLQGNEQAKKSQAEHAKSGAVGDVTTKSDESRVGKSWQTAMGVVAEKATAHVRDMKAQLREALTNKKSALNEAISTAKSKAAKVARGSKNVTSKMVTISDGESGTESKGEFRRFKKHGSIMEMVVFSDGAEKTVSVEDMTEAEGSGMAEIIEYVADGGTHDMSETEANTLAQVYQSVGGDADSVIRSYEMVYLSGYTGMELPANVLPDAAAKAVYDSAKAEAVADEKTRVDRAKAVRRTTKGLVTFLGKVSKDSEVRGAGSEVALSEAMEGMTESQKLTVEAVTEFSKQFKINTVLFESEGEGVCTMQNGSYDASTHTVYIDINSGANSTEDIQRAKEEGTLGYAMVRTLGHEVTHAIEATSASGYAAYKAAVKKKLGKDWSRLVQEKLGNALNRGQKLTLQGAEAEVVADASEYMLQDSKFVENIDKSIRGRVKAVISNFVERVRGIFDRLSVSKMSSGHRESRALRQMKGNVYHYLDNLQQLWDVAAEEMITQSAEAVIDENESYDVPLTVTEETEATPRKSKQLPKLPVEDLDLTSSAQYSYAGRGSENANRSLLHEAQEMEFDEVAPETIRQQTGWFRGMDGEWRYEIDDSQAEYKSAPVAQATKLKHIYSHPVLFEAYPDLAETPVEVLQNLPGNANAGVQGGTIKLNAAKFRDPSGRLAWSEKNKDTLLHEIQHLIQEEEGFASGSNVDYWADKLYPPRKNDRLIKRLNKQIDELYNAHTEEEWSLLMQHEDAELAWANLGIDADPAKEERLLKNLDRLTRELKEKAPGLLEAYRPLSTHLRAAIRANREMTAQELYQKTAGEIEARDAAERRGLTKEQRKATLPALDEDAVFADDVTRPDIRYSQRNTTNAYYGVPFDKQVRELINGNIRGDGMLLLGRTPKVLRDIGLSDLPLMMDQSHARKLREGTTSSTNDDHILSWKTIKNLPALISDPVAVVLSANDEYRTKTVNVIIEAENRYGKQVYTAIALDAVAESSSGRLDINKAATVFGNDSVLEMLNAAVLRTALGGKEVLYLNNKKAAPLYHNSSNLKAGGVIGDGLINTIADADVPVKSKGKKQTETQQFKRWFAGSKVVNEDGTPKVLYHQTENEFYVFDVRHQGAGTRDNETPFGIFMKETDKDIGVKGSRQMALYARIENPLVVQNRSELVRKLQQLSPEYARLKTRAGEIDAEYNAKHQAAIQAFKDYLIQLRENERAAGVQPKTRKELYEDPEFQRVFNAEDEVVEEWTETASENDLLAKEAITKALKDNGYDGIILRVDVGSWGRKTESYIALEPTQVKSATDNVGAFDPQNPDIRYSTRDLPTDAISIREYLGSMTPTSRMTDTERSLLGRYQAHLKTLGEKEAAIAEQEEIIRTAPLRNEDGTINEELQKAKNRIRVLREQAARESRALAAAETSTGFARLMATSRQMVDTYLLGASGSVADAADALDEEVATLTERLKGLAEDITRTAVGQRTAFARGLYDQTQLNAAAKNLKDAYGSRMSVQAIADRLALCFGELYEDGSADGVKRFVDDVRELATDILQGHKYRYKSGVLPLLREKLGTISLTDIDLMEIKNAGLTLAEYKRMLSPYVTVAAGGSDLSSAIDGTMSYGDGTLAAILGEDVEGNLAMRLYEVISNEKAREAEIGTEGMTEGEMITAVMADIAGATLPVAEDSRTIDYLRKELQKHAGASVEAAQLVDEAIAGARKVTGRAGRVWAEAARNAQTAKAAVEYYRKLEEQRRVTELREQKQAIKEQLRSEYAKRLEEKVQKQRAEYREREQKARKYRNSRDEMNKLRRTIGRKVKRLNALRVRETDAKHVPQELQHIADVVMQTFTDSSLGRLAFSYENMASLSRRYHLLKEQENDVAYYWDPEIEEQIELLQTMGEAYTAIRERGAGIPSYFSVEGVEMEMEILNGVDNIVSNVLHMIDDWNDAFISGRTETFNVYAAMTGKELLDKKDFRQWRGGLGTLQKAVDELLRTGNMTPVYYMEHLNSPLLQEVFDAVREGQSRYARIVEEGKAFVQEAKERYHYGAWVADAKLQMKTSQGHQIELTREEAIELYAIAKRERTNKLYLTEHLINGGFQFKDVLKKKGKGMLAAEKTTHQLDAADIARIENWLTAEQKAYADALVGFLSTTMAEYGNEAAMAMFGYKKFNEAYYVPFHTAAEQRYQRGDEGPGGEDAGTGRVKNSGFTKKLTYKANATLVVGGLTDTVSEHIHKMATYAALVEPIENMKRLLNYKMVDKDGTTNTIRALIGKKYGQASQDYMTQLLKDLNGAAQGDERATKGVNWLISAFKRGAVMASASVVLQQPTAIVRAMADIPVKYFGQNPFYRPGKGTWDEMMKYSGTAIIKDMGKFDVGMGLTASQYIADEHLNAVEAYRRLKADSRWEAGKAGFKSFMDWLTAAPGVADQWTWGLIWKANKAYQAALHPEMDPNSEAFLELCGSTFDNVIDHSQVYDSVLTRSNLMRSKNGFHQMATSFMAEPTMSINMLYDAVMGKHSRGKRAAIIGGVMASQVLAGAMAALVQAWNDDEDERNWLEKYADRATGNILGNINIFSMIPYISDLVSLLEGYDVERADMTVASTLITYTGSFFEKVGKGETLTWKDWENFAGNWANLTGVPAKNIMREIRRTLNAVTMTDWSAPNMSNVGLAMSENLIWNSGRNTEYYERIVAADLRGDAQSAEDYREYMLTSKMVSEDALKSGLKKAMKERVIAGDADKQTAIEYLVKIGAYDEADDAYWEVDKWEYVQETGNGADTYRKYDDFAAAVRTGENLKQVIQSYLDHGVSKETLAGQITTAFRKEYVDLYNSGKRSEASVLQSRILTAYVALGYDRNRKLKDVQKWLEEKD